VKDFRQMEKLEYFEVLAKCRHKFIRKNFNTACEFSVKQKRLKIYLDIFFFILEKQLIYYLDDNHFQKSSTMLEIGPRFGTKKKLTNHV